MARDEILDRIASFIGFGMTREQARAGMCCIRCHDAIDDDWTAHDLREWELSLLCGQCFDAIVPEQP